MLIKKTPGSWQYYRDVLALNDSGNIIDFPNDNNNNISFKQQTTVQTLDNGTKSVETKVPLKYLSNFWRTLEIPLVNCEISFTLTWSKYCFLFNGTAANQEPTFTITNTKDLGAYDNIPKIATGKSDDSTTGCLLVYLYF